MKKTATFLMLCLLAMVSLVSCDKEEEGFFHTIQIAEPSSSMAAMEQISSFVTNYTTAYSSQLGYIAKPHAEAQADFEQFCSHLKYKVEEYAKENSFTIHPNAYVVLTLNCEREEMARQRIDFEAYVPSAD